jgi:L-threonylcarbamoyladenylate synthase
MPTDTVPGLHGKADQPGVAARIAQIKGRTSGKPFLLLAGSPAQARDLTQGWSADVERYVSRCWPGPHTLILAAADDVPAAVGAGGQVALRVPAVPLLRAAILAVGYPLISTSVNRAGEKPLTDLVTAARRFGGAIDGWWRPDPRSWRAAMAGAPSSLIDLSSWPPRILRRGHIAPPPW